MTNQLLLKFYRKKQYAFLLLMMLFCANTFAQTTVTGVVADAIGPMPGVTVLVKDTKTSTVTDFDGTYAIKNVPANATLVYSFLGFQNQEILVAGKSVINVTLKESPTTLKDVVVIGYGSVKRGDLTGSVASVSAKSIEQSVVVSVDQALAGRTAGVQLSINSGTPGGSSSLQIRGFSTLSANRNAPIYVVDGVVINGGTQSNSVNPISFLNPSDIASIDILKDTAATAIYGSQAAGGVVLITTKRGKKGELNFSYDGSYGWQQLPKQLATLNLREYATLHNTRSDLGIVQRSNDFIRPDLLGEGTNWQDALFNVAAIKIHNFSASGGSESTNYALSAGYLDQEGIIVGSGFKRFNLRVGVDSQVNKFLKTGATLSFSEQNQIRSVEEYGVINNALSQAPTIAVKNADGSFDGPDTNQFVQTNPIGLASINDNRNTSINLLGNTYIEATILKGLKFKSQYSFSYNFDNEYRFSPSYKFGQVENTIRRGERVKNYGKYWNILNQLTYNNTFGKHNINLLAAQEAQKGYFDQLRGTRVGYLTNGSTDLDAGDALTATNANFSSANSLMSYFARFIYTFDDKYILSGSIRRDGSSRFAPENRWGYFPSASLAWKASNESFLKDSKVINNLKLRLSYGLVGNQNTDNNIFTSNYRSVSTIWGTGLLAQNTANPNVKWEATAGSDAGIDVSLFDSRIEFTADIFYKKTTDLLLSSVLPVYVGVSGQGATNPPVVNIGALENKGLELSLNTVNIENKNYSWTSNFNISFVRNKVLKLNSANGTLNQSLQVGSDITNISRTAVGTPISQYYGYKVIGRFENATDFYYKDAAGVVTPVALPTGATIAENSMWIGDYIFDDINKDGVINEGDLSIIGNPLPDFTFGFNNTFSYQGFDLGILLTGSYGNDAVNYQRRFLENGRSNGNLLQTALGYAQLGLINPNGPNDYRNVQIVGGNPYMPRIAASSFASASNFRFSDRFVEDASYVRIKSINLTYNFPAKFVKRFGLSSFRVFTKMDNVFTFTKYSGYDPEIGSANGNSLLTGIDNGRYPSPTVTTVGFNVNF